MEIIDKHTDGLTKNLRAFQEVYDNHEKALKDHDLTPVYVNLTEPIEQLRDEIDQVVETCREIGSNRFITEHYLNDINARLDVALKKVEDGLLEDIPDWSDPNDIENLAKETRKLEKE